MAEPKLIKPAAITAALEKATRYRLLNEPLQAESICRDILAIEAENQDALITLLLAITDQFDREFAGKFNDANDLLPRIQGDYEQAYYEGIINERWGNAQLGKGEQTSVGWYHAAMRCYAKAEELSPADNDDAVLRWNACVRIIRRHDFAPEKMTQDVHAMYGDDVPMR